MNRKISVNVILEMSSIGYEVIIDQEFQVY